MQRKKLVKKIRFKKTEFSEAKQNLVSFAPL